MDPFVVVLVAMIVLLVAHAIIGRRYLTAFVAAHGNVPDWSWLTKRDDDPEVERWRRMRLAVAIPALVLLALMFVLITSA